MEPSSAEVPEAEWEGLVTLSHRQVRLRPDADWVVIVAGGISGGVSSSTLMLNVTSFLICKGYPESSLFTTLITMTRFGYANFGFSISVVAQQG